MFDIQLINIFNFFPDKYFKKIIRQQNIFKASMWQYTDSLHELTTSVNRILTNDKALYQVEKATTSFFTMFHFPLEDEEQLICVNEYLNDEKNFNAAVIFYKLFLHIFLDISYIFYCNVTNALY